MKIYKEHQQALIKTQERRFWTQLFTYTTHVTPSHLLGAPHHTLLCRRHQLFTSRFLMDPNSIMLMWDSTARCHLEETKVQDVTEKNHTGTSRGLNHASHSLCWLQLDLFYSQNKVIFTTLCVWDPFLQTWACCATRWRTSSWNRRRLSSFCLLFSCWSSSVSKARVWEIYTRHRRNILQNSEKKRWSGMLLL